MKKQKGFTLVELLVVIAILAILATVSIVGYSAFTKKANLSNDEAIVTQMNNALKGYEALDEKAQNPNQAVQQCIENGFIYQNLEAQTKDHKIVYDVVSNRFALVDENNAIIFKDDATKDLGKEIEEGRTQALVDFFVAVDVSEAQPSDLGVFSIYLYLPDDATKDASWNTISNLKAGIDVGDVTGIESVSYLNNADDATAQHVFIRTSGGKLIVNGPKDTVAHYGTATVVNVEAVANASYDEYGVVYGGIYVTKGHVVVNANEETKTAGTVVYVCGNEVDIDIKDDTPAILYKSFSEDDMKTVSITNKNGIEIKTSSETIKEIKAEATNGFYTLAQALDINGTYKLLEDIELAEQLEIASGKSITLDLNGHSITYTGTNIITSGILLVHNGGELIVNDSDGEGAINPGDKTYGAIAVTKINDDSTKPAVLTINGGNITGYYYAIVGNGKRHNTEITINGGYLLATDGSGIYNPQFGTIKVTGGTIEGATGIYLKSGSLTAASSFNGGTIKGTGEKTAHVSLGSGFEATGDAIVIDYAGYPGGDPSALFENVTLISDHAYQIGVYGDETGTPNIVSSTEFTLNSEFKWEEISNTGTYKVVAK